METDRLKLNSELQLLANSLKILINEELTTAFGKEIKAYEDFITAKNQAYEEYYKGFAEYKETKHTSTFLHKNIQLNSQIIIALQKLSDKDQPIFFPGTLSAISEKAIGLVAELGHNEKTNFYKAIAKHKELQEQKKKFVERKAKYLLSLIWNKPELEPREAINSILYLYFENTITKVLNKRESELFEFYHNLAKLAQNFWIEFDMNIAFVRKLDTQNYEYEKIEPADLNWKLTNSTPSQLDEIKANFQHFCNELVTELENSILNFDFDIVFNQKIKSFSLEKILSAKNIYYLNLDKNEMLWKNTRMVFSEDWINTLEILSLKYKILQEYFKFIKAFNTDFNLPFNNLVQKFESHFENLMNDLTGDITPISDSEFQLRLNELKLQLKKELILKTLPIVSKLLKNPDIIAHIDSFEGNADTILSSLSKERHLMKKPDYLRRVNINEIEVISPNDLISFEIKPAFKIVFPEFRNAFISHLKILQDKLHTAPSIAAFSIESAILHFDKNRNFDEAKVMYRDGAKRSHDRMQEAKTLNEEFFISESKKISTAIKKMVFSTEEITNNESALKIKIRIVKAKALAHSKEVGNLFISNLLKSLRVIINYLKTKFLLIQDFSIQILKKFRPDKTSLFVSTDISDYLNTTQAEIEKLPFVYQRLFSSDPLDTFELYVERKTSMAAINVAFSRWTEGKFAPVILIGERGSGKTTFIRKFIQTKSSKLPCTFINLIENNKKPDLLFNEILEACKNNDPKESQKKIIVIDGLERLFESKINGFEYLIKLFKLISESQKDIFWVVSVHSVSWNYFDKSIFASNYFGYHIQLNDLDYSELVDLIESRHNLSGYKITFADELKKKNLLDTMSADDKANQEQLRKVFFKTLNKNVRGNILQAYIFWMRSASLVENNIVIKFDNQLEFNFVRSLSSAKLILLRSILIHNGLDADKMAELFRINKSSSELQLIQLADDGILSLSRGTYLINPLIYKQLIDHLTGINLIH